MLLLLLLRLLLCGRGRDRRIGHNGWFPCINKDNTSILINLREACKL